MKVCLIGPQISDFDHVYNFSSVWVWYISRELQRNGINICWARNVSEVYQHENVDHVLAFGMRYFSIYPGAVELHDHIKGTVCQLHESVRDDDGVDCTFSIRDVQHDKCVSIDWAADHNLFYPEQDENNPMVLIDHPHYDERQEESVLSVLEKCKAYDGDRFKFMRLTGNGIESLESSSNNFQRTKIPYRVMASITRKTAVFVVTHHESCGLQCLEANMSGAIVVAPRGYLNQDRIKTLRVVEFDDEIPWKEIEEQYDSNTIRDSVLHMTWSRVVSRIMDYWSEKAGEL